MNPGARLYGGESTAIVIFVTPAGVEGASVGGSGAWVIRGTEIEDLTARQVRKPLVGAGCTPSAIVAARSAEAPCWSRQTVC